MYQVFIITIKAHRLSIQFNSIQRYFSDKHVGLHGRRIVDALK